MWSHDNVLKYTFKLNCYSSSFKQVTTLNVLIIYLISGRSRWDVLEYYLHKSRWRKKIFHNFVMKWRLNTIICKETRGNILIKWKYQVFKCFEGEFLFFAFLSAKFGVYWFNWTMGRDTLTYMYECTRNLPEYTRWEPNKIQIMNIYPFNFFYFDGFRYYFNRLESINSYIINNILIWIQRFSLLLDRLLFQKQGINIWQIYL